MSSGIKTENLIWLLHPNKARWAVKKRLAVIARSDTMRVVTNLTDEQFEIVVREIEAMRKHDDHDEAWRVLRMFENRLFNRGLDAFPQDEQKWFATGDHARNRSYPQLLARIETVVSESPVFRVARIGAVAGLDVIKLETAPPASSYAVQLGICVVTGIHGDEADGVLASLEFARRFAASFDLVNAYALTIYPCVNPVGYERMTRENGNGKDLNREFFRDSVEEEVKIMERELHDREITGMISGHSDYESFGLYAYATGAVLSERLAKPALFQASAVIPINTDPVIDGHPAEYGIINQKFPGSLGPLTKGNAEPFDITFETPNLFALRKRVEAQAIGFETILQEYRAVASEGMYL